MMDALLWTLAFCQLPFTTCTRQACSEQQYACASRRWRGACVPLAAVCDGRAGDCDDGSDEAHCDSLVSIDITGAGLELALNSSSYKIYNYQFDKMKKDLHLTCSLTSRGRPLRDHVLKMQDEFGLGDIKKGNTVGNNTETITVSYKFKINAKSKTIYCIAADLNGQTYLGLVNLVYQATPSGSDCSPNYNVKPNSLVVIKDEELPPPLWLVGYVKKVFPKIEGDSTSFGVALIITREGVLIKGFDVLCSLP